VEPSQAFIQSDKRQTFFAKGLDQFGRNFELGKVDWTATGGTIEDNGVYQAGQEEGNFLVTAKIGKLAGQASVSVSKEAGKTKPIPPRDKPASLSWSGEVSPQKWMNFYTKVLTRFVKTDNLKITVSFEASSKEGISEQQIEETKAALRELGLDDNLKSN
jgi:hypothetical protein